MDSFVKHRQQLLAKGDGLSTESEGSVSRVDVQSRGALAVSSKEVSGSQQSLAHLEVLQDGSAVWTLSPPHEMFHEATADLAEDDFQSPMPLVLFSKKPTVLASATKSPGSSVYRYSGEECFLNVAMVKALLEKVPTRSILNKENYHKDA